MFTNLSLLHIIKIITIVQIWSLNLEKCLRTINIGDPVRSLAVNSYDGYDIVLCISTQFSYYYDINHMQTRTEKNTGQPCKKIIAHSMSNLLFLCKFFCY